MPAIGPGSPEPLGVTPREGGANVAVFSAHASAIELCLFDAGGEAELDQWIEYLRAIGHPFTEWRDAGLESPVLESFVQYRQPLAFDDEITVHLRLADVTRATFQMAYLITVDDDGGVARPRATGVTVHGCVTTAGRPTRLPAWLTDMADGR